MLNVTEGEMSGDWLGDRAAERGSSIFIEHRGRSLSYGEVEDLVGQRARRLGGRQGEQIEVRPRIDVASVVELLAVSRVGATAVVTIPDRADSDRLASLAGRDRRPAHSVLFTGGSTGQPKGVRISSTNWEAAASASQGHLEHGEGDRWLCPLPLYHMGGLGALYRVLLTGGVLVLSEGLEVGLLRGVQWASVVATQVHRLLSAAGPVRSQARLLVGGGPTSSQLLAEGEERGLNLLPSYGMTETTGQVATAQQPGGAMRILPGLEIGLGDEGNLMVRGPSVMMGYVGEPEVGGWFRTLDLGHMEDDGSLVVDGRIDRLIITGGEKVNPDVIAGALSHHPDIDEVFVLGLPDPEWGEIVVAVYAGAAGPDQLNRWDFEALPRHARPKRWLQVESLPRTELGKVDMLALQQLVDS